MSTTESSKRHREVLQEAMDLYKTHSPLAELLDVAIYFSNDIESDSEEDLKDLKSCSGRAVVERPPTPSFPGVTPSLWMHAKASTVYGYEGSQDGARPAVNDAPRTNATPRIIRAPTIPGHIAPASSNPVAPSSPAQSPRLQECECVRKPTFDQVRASVTSKLEFLYSDANTGVSTGGRDNEDVIERAKLWRFSDRVNSFSMLLINFARAQLQDDAVCELFFPVGVVGFDGRAPCAPGSADAEPVEATSPGGPPSSAGAGHRSVAHAHPHDYAQIIPKLRIIRLCWLVALAISTFPPPLGNKQLADEAAGNLAKFFNDNERMLEAALPSTRPWPWVRCGTRPQEEPGCKSPPGQLATPTGPSTQAPPGGTGTIVATGAAPAVGESSALNCGADNASASARNTDNSGSTTTTGVEQNRQCASSFLDHGSILAGVRASVPLLEAGRVATMSQTGRGEGTGTCPPFAVSVEGNGGSIVKGGVGTGRATFKLS